MKYWRHVYKSHNIVLHFGQYMSNGFNEKAKVSHHIFVWLLHGMALVMQSKDLNRDGCVQNRQIKTNVPFHVSWFGWNLSFVGNEVLIAIHFHDPYLRLTINIMSCPAIHADTK